MAAMLRARPRLVLAVFDFLVGDDVQTVLLGRPDFAKNAQLRLGYSGLPEDPGRVLRRTDYEVAPAPGARFPTLALQGARIATGRPLPAAELPSATRRRWNSQSTRTTWIDYRGGPGTVRSVPFADVLGDRLPHGFFRDKLVVVGTTARAGGDVHRTPAAGGSMMSGPEIQAQALDTVRRGAPLRDVPRLVDALAIVLLAIVPVMAFSLRRRAVRVGLVLAAGAAFLLAAQLSFDLGRIVAVVPPLVALAASATGVLLAGLAQRVVLRRSRTPATASPVLERERR
jgi:CHASE2 domain-containing sensor protein